jgi:hydroxymethylpyrimidine/phosphomethylpyrimidine kinase
MRTALTIAGSDSGAGAGIQADLKTFAALGVYGTSAITALTAQNTERVTRVFTIPPDMVVAQIDAVADDISIDAVKTGMLATPEIVMAVADALARRHLPRIVVDPVMVAKGGDLLLTAEGVVCVRTHLLRCALVVTPNRPEAEVLTGRGVATLADAREAARVLHGCGAGAVVVKGGHFDGDVLINLLFDGRDFFEFATPRIATRHTHGTGCTFASAIAAGLALGDTVPAAVQRATEYVAGAIAAGLPVGHGHGPVDHFWQRRRR